MDSTSERTTVRDRLRRALSPEMKKQLAALVCHPLVGRAIAAASGDRIRSGPLKIHTDGSTISPRTKAQIFWGIYESAEIRMLRKYLKPDLDLLEIGSSLGVVSSHALDCLSQSSQVVCIEANPNLIPVIQKNLESNHPGRKAVVLNRAVDYENAPGTTRMRITEDTAGSRLGRFAASETTTVQEIDVPASTVSKLVSENGLRDFVLISDIEGAEAGFIFADSSELDGCKQMIIELHDTKYQGRDLRWQDLLQELCSRFGFRVIDGFGPVQVLER